MQSFGRAPPTIYTSYLHKSGLKCQLSNFYSMGLSSVSSAVACKKILSYFKMAGTEIKSVIFQSRNLGREKFWRQIYSFVWLYILEFSSRALGFLGGQNVPTWWRHRRFFPPNRDVESRGARAETRLFAHVDMIHAR